MPQPTAPRPTPTAEREIPQPGPTAPTKAADLTVNKVLAGAGAAATSAVLGSYFGATGTVFGAALGSVASTVATTIYQRSLDRTRDTIVARVRVPRSGQTEIADAPTVRLEVPEPRVSPEDATTGLRVEPALRRPRRVWMWAGVTVLVFVLSLLVVTGLEWAKGSTLSTGESGTSVGRVLAPAPDPAAGIADDTDDDSTGPATEPTAESGRDTTGTDGSDRDGPSTAEPTPTAEPTGAPTPTGGPGSGADPDPPAGGGRGGTGGGALPTPEVPVPAAPQDG